MSIKSAQPVLFISYSSRDEFQIRQIATELRKLMPVYTYYFDIPGDSSISERIKIEPGSNMLAIALSPSSINTPWIKSDIKGAVLEPFKDSLTKIFLLKLSDIPETEIRSLSYPITHEVIDLSGEHYTTGMAALVQRLGLPSALSTPRRRLESYEISGVFQPARPATLLFADLKRQIEEGAIDQKFLYWDVRAALRWQRTAELSTYMTSQMSMNLLVVNAGDIVERICSDAQCEEISFINLGVGTGVKDYHILSHLLNRTRKVAYFACDESFPMIQLTMQTLEELMSTNRDSLNAHYIVDDFTNLEKHKKYVEDVAPRDAPKIIGFLGGSLGNFRELRILRAIRGLMLEKDYLLLGVEYIGGRDEKTLISNYSDIRTKEFMFGPIMDVTGRRPNWNDDFRYEVLTGARLGYSDVENSKTVVGKVTNNGKEIELFSSTKYERESLEYFLQQKAAFKKLAVFTSPEIPPRYGKYILKLA